jgi:predicted nucleic acid-binding protein
MGDSFLDTNVLLYLASDDLEKAQRVEALLAEGCTISVQVLNELASVARRKMKLEWDETRDFLGLVRGLTMVEPVSVDTHDEGLRVAARYRLSIYDGMIIGGALLAQCETLWSEDMQEGLRVDGRLTVRNPFRLAAGPGVSG